MATIAPMTSVLISPGMSLANSAAWMAISSIVKHKAFEDFFAHACLELQVQQGVVRQEKDVVGPVLLL